MKKRLLILGLLLSFSLVLTPVTAYAVNRCGSAKRGVVTAINIGCQGTGNAVTDMLFALIRFLSAGVGLVIVGSFVWASIQYIISRGDPGATAKAIDRIRSSLFALGMFIFAYAILNFIIPGGFFT